MSNAFRYIETIEQAVTLSRPPPPLFASILLLPTSSSCVAKGRNSAPKLEFPRFLRTCRGCARLCNARCKQALLAQTLFAPTKNASNRDRKKAPVHRTGAV